MYQGYLYTSTVDYLTQDPAHISYIWILMVSGWMLPNIVMVTFHAMVIIAFRCSRLSVRVVINHHSYL